MIAKLMDFCLLFHLEEQERQRGARARAGAGAAGVQEKNNVLKNSVKEIRGKAKAHS